MSFIILALESPIKVEINRDVYIFVIIIQPNLDYPDFDFPDFSIIRTFFSGPNFV